MTTLTADRRITPAGNTDTDYLKLVALVFMMIDHTGVALLGNLTEMRILGRIAIAHLCLVPGRGVRVYTQHWPLFAAAAADGGTIAAL